MDKFNIEKNLNGHFFFFSDPAYHTPCSTPAWHSASPLQVCFTSISLHMCFRSSGSLLWHLSSPRSWVRVRLRVSLFVVPDLSSLSKHPYQSLFLHLAVQLYFPNKFSFSIRSEVWCPEGNPTYVFLSNFIGFCFHLSRHLQSFFTLSWSMLMEFIHWLDMVASVLRSPWKAMRQV